MKRVIALSAIIFFTLLVLPILVAVSEEEEESQAEVAQQVLAEESKSGYVTLDFEDADIRGVITIIALASGMNMVIGEDVEAKVTLSLVDVHWERALDIILRTYNFTYKKEKNLVRIITFEKLKQEERDIPLSTKIVYLNFANVSDMKSTLTKSLSERGSIEVDKRTNSMIITDIPAKLEEIAAIAKKLDSPTPQVLIEAMLVDVKLTKDDELGINWKALQVNIPESQEGKGDENFIEQPSSPMGTITSAAIKLGFLKRFGSYGVDGLVSAWLQDAKANILASPKIVTLDNQTAKIEIKSQVAYTQTTASTESANALTTTQFKDVITSLEVTPHITKAGFISMNIKPKQEFVEATINGQPQIGSRSAETNVLVGDGETIVIGGLRKVEDNATITKVPFLGDIPILGNLFRKKDYNKVNTELVMFVTPRIIVHPELSDEEIDAYQMLDEAREDFLKMRKKEKRKRLKISKKQALLVEPAIGEEITLPRREQPEEIKLAPAPIVPEKKKEKELESEPGYIYVW